MRRRVAADSFSWQLTYTGVAIDRAAEVRPFPKKISELGESKRARILPVWDGNHFFQSDSLEAISILVSEAQEAISSEESLIFLGCSDDTPWFALALTGDAPPSSLSERGEFAPLHPRVGTLPADQAALLSYARGMVIWHLNHLHCGRCGSVTGAQDGGHIRRCSDPECGHRMFPRVDPAVITLVVHPDGDKCLLGRQGRWPEGMYSVVAGFVEPGESLEECVVREVKEETGIVTTDVEYVASQPWPFPTSLMLGFTAQAITTKFDPSDDELDDIRWIHRDDLATFGEMGDGKEGPKLPNSFSIARMLIERWRASF